LPRSTARIVVSIACLRRLATASGYTHGIPMN
jgi:hypothetical protein